MFIQLILLLGIFLFALIFYKLTDHYAQRYLGFNSTDHLPLCTPGSSSPSTLVCVLGWGGCTRRQLRRLLDFYSLHGITTISWISPMFNYIFGIEQKQIEHVLDLLVHENRTSKNIIIHLHSNNGALAWGSMLNIIQTNERYQQLLPNIKGIIFDSSPFVRFSNSQDWLIVSAVGTSRAGVSVILNRAQYFHWIWTPLITYYLFLRLLYRRYFSSHPTSASDQVRDLLNVTPIDIKQYYLYSNSDRLIPSYIIEQFMASQVKRGVQVQSYRFVDSGHVNHFRTYPIEYGKLVLDFVENIQKDNLSDK